MEAAKKYRKRVEDNRFKQLKMESYSERLSRMRLFIFLGGSALSAFVFHTYDDKTYGCVLVVLLLVVFISLVIKHEKVINEANRYRNMVEINKKCILRMEGNWGDFSDDGVEYVNPHHSYTNDLDIFGHGSLFQWINTSNTYSGREALRTLLENPDKEIHSIRQRQDAVKELGFKTEFCQRLQCEGMGIDNLKNNPEDIMEYAEQKSKFFSKRWLKPVFFVLPGLTILSFLVWYFDRSILFYGPLLLLALQAMIILWGYRKINDVLATVYSYKTKVAVYQHLLEVIEKEEFRDAYLVSLQSNLFRGHEAASQEIKKLDSIVGAVGLRHNPLLHFPVNIMLFWDFHCVLALENWQARSGTSLRQWLDTIGCLEALSSLTLISQLNPQWAFPEFSEETAFFAAEDLGHPLISNQKRVANHFANNDQICIVTGSNMSGKTTFLRTIGINLVLAYAGAPVCAKKLKCSLLDIFTSMRIADDLNGGISTFYAELLRIRMIIENSKKEKAMIYLIDEVFRGTNSADRVIGARNVLLNLDKAWIIGLISTHDFELCNLEKGSNGRVKNYHFIETYIDNEINFNYKIRPGRCKTTNAQFLMKMVGIEVRD